MITEKNLQKHLKYWAKHEITQNLADPGKIEVFSDKKAPHDKTSLVVPELPKSASKAS
jgi:hypothetical protein